MNLLSNDGQRIFEAVALGPLLIPGPVVLLFGLVYMFILIGPWSLIAMGTYGGFYPFMVSLFYTWVRVFRFIPEFRILRLTFHRKSASNC